MPRTAQRSYSLSYLSRVNDNRDTHDALIADRIRYISYSLISTGKGEKGIYEKVGQRTR